MAVVLGETSPFAASCPPLPRPIGSLCLISGLEHWRSFCPRTAGDGAGGGVADGGSGGFSRWGSWCGWAARGRCWRCCAGRCCPLQLVLKMTRPGCWPPCARSVSSASSRTITTSRRPPTTRRQSPRKPEGAPGGLLDRGEEVSEQLECTTSVPAVHTMDIWRASNLQRFESNVTWFIVAEPVTMATWHIAKHNLFRENQSGNRKKLLGQESASRTRVLRQRLRVNILLFSLFSNLCVHHYVEDF